MAETGVLLRVSPEALFSLGKVRFSSIRFVVSAVIPILVLVLHLDY